MALKDWRKIATHQWTNKNVTKEEDSDYLLEINRFTKTGKKNEPTEWVDVVIWNFHEMILKKKTFESEQKAHKFAKDYMREN